MLFNNINAQINLINTKGAKGVSLNTWHNA